ncbi:MAG: hypothetical protein PF692_04900 [Kiritimatiellae bacterium]|nr:hypothetical protein [Kiritimatiellia bacterium]
MAKVKKSIDYKHGQCRLCKSDGKLCYSHIIPEFLFKPIYNEKHQITIVDDSKEVYSTIQKGVREHLLCKKCEGLFEKWEKYFLELWFEELNITVMNEKLLKSENIDYDKFKLFHLSILWRAGISSLPSFSEVKLGVHEEKLRKMLLAQSPGSSKHYQMFGYILVWPDNTVLKELIDMPSRVKLYDHWGYQFIFGGAAWHYVVSSHTCEDHVPYALNEDGTVCMLRGPIEKYPTIVDLFKKRSNNGWDVVK